MSSTDWKPPLGGAACPGCSGPILVRPGDPNGITVDFKCDNTSCSFGKWSDGDNPKEEDA